MKKKWLVGGTALVLLAGAGVALWTGVLQGPDGQAAARSEATAAKGGKSDKKPDVPLEFAAREVVQPDAGAHAAGGGVLRAAGGAADLGAARQGRRHAGVAERGRRQPRAGRAGAGPHRHGRDQQPRGRAQRQSGIGPRHAGAGRAHARQQRAAGGAAVHLARSRWTIRAPPWTRRAPQLNAAQAALDTTRVGLRDATLLAPIAGIVAKRHALPGEKVSLEQPVLTIVDLARLELAGSVGTHEVGRLLGRAAGAGAGGRRGAAGGRRASRASRRRPSRARGPSA